MHDNDMKIDLSHNKISSINVADAEYLAQSFRSRFKKFSVSLNLKENPLECSCHLRNFASLMKNQTYIDIQQQRLRCFSPSWIKGKLMSDLSVEDLLKCRVRSTDPKDICYSTCSCYEHEKDKTFEVDCSYQNLTELPMLKIQNAISLNLTGNSFVNVPSVKHFEMLKSLILVGNQKASVNSDLLPDSLQVLKLRDNRLFHLDDSMARLLKKLNSSSLKIVTLYDNP